MENSKDVVYPFTEYNTQRKKLVLPEYGRPIQKRIQYVANIQDRGKRNEQIMALVSIMGDLNPHLRDVNDFKHKLWDHVQIIADFNIDIDSPYPIPSRESFQEKPSIIPHVTTPVRIMHYGRNVQGMIDAISERPADENNDALVVTLGNFMKREYLTWNKDSVTDEIIFRDIVALSKGRIRITPEMRLADIQNEVLQELHNRSPKAASALKKKKKKKKKKKSGFTN
jgi:ribosomal protein L21